jgi:acyl dehydratase
MGFESLEELRKAVGTEVGVSDWLQIDQPRINLFADATDDHQWIHVDPQAAAQGPFGTTVAHGYLTLALLPKLSEGVVRVKGVRMGVNYGLNKMRLPSPLPIGAKVRARATLAGYEPIQGGGSATFGLTFEVENQAKPTCVAEVIYRYYA